MTSLNVVYQLIYCVATYSVQRSAIGNMVWSISATKGQQVKR